MAKRILIMGAGAVGSYVGGYMARMGEDVIFVDPGLGHITVIMDDVESLTTEMFKHSGSDDWFNGCNLSGEAPVDIAFMRKVTRYSLGNNAH